MSIIESDSAEPDSRKSGTANTGRAKYNSKESDTEILLFALTVHTASSGAREPIISNLRQISMYIRRVLDEYSAIVSS